MVSRKADGYEWRYQAATVAAGFSIEKWRNFFADCC